MASKMNKERFRGKNGFDLILNSKKARQSA